MCRGLLSKSTCASVHRIEVGCIYLLLLLCTSIQSQAQITEGGILSDSLIRAGYTNLGRAGFDSTAFNGFYIQDARKAKFRLNIGVWTTPRYNYITRNNTPDSINNVDRIYNINRTRIYFTGKYSNFFSFALVTNIAADGEFNLQQAYLTWKINEQYILSLGTQFVASSREDWMDPANILSMHCSANDAVFALGTSFGALLYRRPKNHMRWWVSLSNGLYGWNRIVSDSDQSDYMLGGRYEYALNGNDWTIWDDLVGRRGRSKDILFGAAVNYLRHTVGQLKNHATQINLDVTLNGDGYQVLMAGVWTGQFPDEANNFSQYGLYVQGGYFVNKLVQLYGRYDLIAPGNSPGDYQLYSAPGFGINIYPFHFTNKWKFTLEYNRLYSVLNNTIAPRDLSLGFVESDYYGQHSLRFQLQFGF